MKNKEQFTFNLSARYSDSEGYYYGIRDILLVIHPIFEMMKTGILK